MVRYREVVFGVIFGIGAGMIDIVMHARMTQRSLLEELIWPAPEMLFYRALFMLFGIGIGVLLWQKSKREREARQLSDLLGKLRHDISASATIIHANVQLLLTQQGSSASTDAESVLQSIHQQSQKLLAVLRE